jgi:hypothetical protein
MATEACLSALVEPHWAPTFRDVTAVADFGYPFLASLQFAVNGKYPSSRFDRMRRTIQIHALAGAIIIYLGAYLHIQNEASTITTCSDTSARRKWMYYILGVTSLVHCVTVFLVCPKVMGERRITMPLYLGAGVVNLGNAINLLREPTLHHAMLLWGSTNVFIYVRFHVLLLSLAEIDWSLNYTYSIISAAALSYPMTLQDVRVYWLLVAPLVHSPFHEHICRFLGWDAEDTTMLQPAVKDTHMHEKVKSALGTLSSRSANIALNKRDKVDGGSIGGSGSASGSASGSTSESTHSTDVGLEATDTVETEVPPQMMKRQSQPNRTRTRKSTNAENLRGILETTRQSLSATRQSLMDKAVTSFQHYESHAEESEPVPPWNTVVTVMRAKKKILRPLRGGATRNQAEEENGGEEKRCTLTETQMTNLGEPTSNPIKSTDGAVGMVWRLFFNPLKCTERTGNDVRRV